ncbi:hypothetical protein DXG03_003569 [Asterophora parasitica]|uniref:Methylated-DNA--protein-cysteine methyltransferase n=1 Tax=Asterophora parasitica TaxID=117018 RepID=A0A9P7G3I1_9AGAR|nr:hypothetical protein DXG03_003569 [Asterophora parasitica]
MPVLRIEKETFAYAPVKSKGLLCAERRRVPPAELVANKPDATNKFPVTDWNEDKIFYPTTNGEREAYRSPSGKAVTAHQWDVYDFVFTIPHGKVTTYKDVCKSVGGSPRSVGNALSRNPFAPYIPCHRVIASNLFVGGFFGEWGKNHRTGMHRDQKLELLKHEGVRFTEKDVLARKENVWRG